MEVIEKIKKLLIMSERNTKGAETEANIALEMATSLMEKYNISAKELNYNEREKNLGKMKNERYMEKQFKNYERVLLKSLSKLFDCCVIYEKSITSSRKWHANILGREGNIKTVQIMYEWIVKKSREEGKKLYGSKISKINDYCLGVSMAIYKKVNSIKEKQNNEEWAIVIYSETEDFVKTCYPTLLEKKWNSKSNINYNCYNAGVSEGNNINLNKQFGLKCIAQ